MKSGGGKRKGSGFEREVCRRLSLWVSYDKRDDIFWRSSLSGGRATVAFKKGKQNQTQCGDISAIHPMGNILTEKFLISCKFYKDLKIAGAVTGSKGGLTEFWEECVEEAKRYNKLPMLIAKQNNTQPFICLNLEGAEELRITNIYLALLPIMGGMRILWFDKFISTAKPPGTRSFNRPRVQIL